MKWGTGQSPGASSVFLASWCTALRFAGAAGFLVLFLGRQLGGLTRLELIQGGGLGALAGFALVLQMDGMAYTLASTSAFLTQGYVVWIPIWVAMFSRRWPGWAVPGASVLSVVGAGLLGWRSDDGGKASWQWGRGEWETLAGSLLFAAQILWLERPIFRGNQSFRTTAVMFSVIFLTALAMAIVTSPDPQWEPFLESFRSPKSITLLLALIVFCTLLTFPTANHWQPMVSATQAGLLYCSEPLFTSLVALWLPGWVAAWTGITYANEALTWNLVGGGALILLANIWLQLRPPPRTT